MIPNPGSRFAKWLVIRLATARVNLASELLRDEQNRENAANIGNSSPQKLWSRASWSQ
jgi:hypothetical protein